MNSPSLFSRRAGLLVAGIATVAIAACSERSLLGPSQSTAGPAANASEVRIALACTALVSTGAVKCGSAADDNGVSKDIFGGQNVYVKLTSSNVSYNTVGGPDIFQFDVNIQNLMNEAIGTPDGTVLDTAGIRVFFQDPPTATSGSGVITIVNADGTGTFTAAGQQYYQYNEKLAHNAISASKTWKFNVPATVNTFAFTVYLSTTTQPLLVINEIMVNPSIPDAQGEWVELYNAGSRAVNLQGLVIADSLPPVRGTYAAITASLVVAPGGYVVLGRGNTAISGGAPIDYQYSNMAFSNTSTGDAFMISRVYGTDTLLIDHTQWTFPGTTGTDGISRELINPLLDNSNTNSANWANGTVTYGTGGKGTPKAQNTAFVP